MGGQVEMYRDWTSLKSGHIWSDFLWGLLGEIVQWSHLRAPFIAIVFSATVWAIPSVLPLSCSKANSSQLAAWKAKQPKQKKHDPPNTLIPRNSHLAITITIQLPVQPSQFLRDSMPSGASAIGEGSSASGTEGSDEALKNHGKAARRSHFCRKIMACRVLKSAEIVSEMVIECYIGYSVYVVYIDMLYYIYTHKHSCIHICTAIILRLFSGSDLVTTIHLYVVGACWCNLKSRLLCLLKLVNLSASCGIHHPLFSGHQASCLARQSVCTVASANV